MARIWSGETLCQSSDSWYQATLVRHKIMEIIDEIDWSWSQTIVTREKSGLWGGRTVTQSIQVLSILTSQVQAALWLVDNYLHLSSELDCLYSRWSGLGWRGQVYRHDTVHLYTGLSTAGWPHVDKCTILQCHYTMLQFLSLSLAVSPATGSSWIIGSLSEG